MVRCNPQDLLEVLESLIINVRVVEAEAPNVDGIGTKAVQSQNIAVR